MNQGKGASFSNGNSMANGQALGNGPYAQERRDGWLISPARIWDHMEPGLPA